MNTAGIVFPRPFWRGEGGGREVLTLAYPLILSQMSFTVQVFVDRLFLTWYSAEAVAGAVTGLFALGAGVVTAALMPVVGPVFALAGHAEELRVHEVVYARILLAGGFPIVLM